MLLIPRTFGELKDAVEGSQIEADDVVRLITEIVPVIALPKRLAGMAAATTNVAHESFVISHLILQLVAQNAFETTIIVLSPGLWELNIQTQTRAISGATTILEVDVAFFDSGSRYATIMRQGITTSEANSSITSTKFNTLIDRELALVMSGDGTTAGESFEMITSVQGSKLL